MNKKVYDTVIIGGGPVGIFAAYYACMRGLKTCIIEALPTLGGQPDVLYSQKKIYDVPGFIGITGKDLTDKLIEQLNLFDYDIKTKTIVKSITQENDLDFKIETNLETINSKTVILATGNGSFEPRKLSFDYDGKLDDNQVDYIVEDLEKYRDKDVLVAGGGDSAVDWALELQNIANQVYLVHRRDNFRALSSSIDKLKQSSVKLITPYLIKQIDATPDKKIDIKLLKSKTKDEFDSIVVDNVIVNYGFINDSDLVRNSGLELSGPFVKVNQRMETNIKNIYAIGDIAEYNGKLKLIAVGFGEAATAVAQAMVNIYPDRAYYKHSSDLFN